VILLISDGHFSANSRSSRQLSSAQVGNGAHLAHPTFSSPRFPSFEHTLAVIRFLRSMRAQLIVLIGKLDSRYCFKIVCARGSPFRKLSSDVRKCQPASFQELALYFYFMIHTPSIPFQSHFPIQPYLFFPPVLIISPINLRPINDLPLSNSPSSSPQIQLFMGPTQSVSPSAHVNRVFSSDIYMPIDAVRTNNERGNSLLTGPIPPLRAPHRSAILRTGFQGVWSVFVSSTLGPAPRTGHFCCYDEATHTAYIGYGLTSDATALFDLWALDAIEYVWRSIPLRGQVPSGRSGTRAALLGDLLYCFGGYVDGTYLGDLHTINVNTGEVALLETSGAAPSPRSTPIVAIYANRLYVWGGFNMESPSELSVLDLETLVWSQHAQEVAGRTAVPGVIVGNILYSYGGSKSGLMVLLNLDRFVLETRETVGAEPPGGVMGAGMVIVDKYLFFFGGRANNDWTLMYACDIGRMWWFVFHVVPDGETVSITDGSISEIGLFMLPRLHSFGMCYVRETKQIVAFLGHPENDPPPLFVVSCGEALSVIHMREDMMAALKM
jgi:hypothetical protein